MYSQYVVEIVKLYLSHNPNNLSLEEYVKMFEDLYNKVLTLTTED